MTWRQNPPSRPIAFKTSSFLTFFSCIWTVICHFTDSHISQWLPTRGDYRRDKENEAEVGINFTHLQIRSESSITALQWAALVLLPNPFSPPPYVNFTTVSGGGCFSQSGSVNGVHVYLAINVPSIPFPRSHVFVFSCLPHWPYLFCLCLRPLSLLPGSFGLPGSFAIQGFITLVMITPGCLASCPHASLCPIIESISTVGLDKEALGLKLLQSVTKGYWPIQMWCCYSMVVNQKHETWMLCLL